MNAPTKTREVEETTGRRSGIDRWLVVSGPLAIDDDPIWDEDAERNGDHVATA
jgi:hypothetical protein